MTQDALEVVIVEDHLALRKGIELLLRNEGIRVTGVAAAPAEGLRMIAERRPDVAIVDIGLEAGSGLALVRSLLQDDPGSGVLVYTGSHDKALLREALGSGARGFALKAGSLAELLTAVRTVGAGGEYVDPRLAQMLDAPDSETLGLLSKREREIVDLLAAGLNGPEIAERLVLSPLTVDTHVRNVMRKLGAHTRVHAVALALRDSDGDQ